MDGTPSAGEVTKLLLRASEGDEESRNELLSFVYDELRQLARQQLRRERPDHTLEGTALVHEAFVRLAGDAAPGWKNRAHFFGIAARCMRQVLVDHARSRGSLKRGGSWERTSLTNKGLGVVLPLTELVALDDALEKLGELDPRLLTVVEYRFFGGLEEREVAELLGVSTRTVQRDWAAARAWLYKELHGTPGTPDTTQAELA